MNYVFFVSCFLLGLFFPKSKFVGAILLVYMFVLMAFNTTNADYANYESMYVFVGRDAYDGQIREFGYVFLVKLSNLLGMDYQFFLSCIAALCITMLWIAIKNYCQAPNSVLSFVLLYPLFINIIQLRFFLALVIVLYFLRYLEEFNGRNCIKFLMGLLLAMSFHVSAAVFGVLLLLYTRRKEIVVSIFVLILLVALLGFLLFDGDTSLGIIQVKLSSYFENNYFTFNKTLRTLVLGLSALILLWCIRLSEVDNKKTDFLFSSATLIIVVSTIAIFISNEFERFSRLGYIIIYILFFNMLHSQRVLFINKLLASGLFLVTMSGYIFFQYYFRESEGVPFVDAVFKTIIENNSVIK